MVFGQTIKKLRREADLTQDQLAEMLSISPQAVSRWETGTAMPDISLLPTLTNIFGVTSDELLGINIEQNSEKIRAILEKARIATHNGNFQESCEILREGKRHFPCSFVIMQALAESLICVNSRKGQKDYSEVIGLCESILAGCTDSTIRYKTLDNLACAYAYAGRREDMMRIADQMAPFENCREAFMVYRTDFDEKGFVKRQEWLLLLVEELLSSLTLLPYHRRENDEMIYSSEERIAILKQAIDVAEILYPDGDYQLKGQLLDSAADLLVRQYLDCGDRENALYWLERASKYITAFDTYGFDDPHTSLAFRGYADGGWILDSNGNRSAQYFKSYSESSIFDPIRNDPRFEAVMIRLKETARP